MANKLISLAVERYLAAKQVASLVDTAGLSLSKEVADRIVLEEENFLIQTVDRVKASRLHDTNPRNYPAPFECRKFTEEERRDAYASHGIFVKGEDKHILSCQYPLNERILRVLGIAYEMGRLAATQPSKDQA